MVERSGINWKGKALEDYSKEQLIGITKELGIVIDNLTQDALKTIEGLGGLGRARNR